jgi:hypothetical protein
MSTIILLAYTAVSIAVAILVTGASSYECRGDDTRIDPRDPRHAGLGLAVGAFWLLLLVFLILILTIYALMEGGRRLGVYIISSTEPYWRPAITETTEKLK